MFILIFVTVGSRPYPFDRLFKKIDNLIEEGIINDDVFAQIGSSKYQPKNYEFSDYISQEEFISYIEKSDIVISHGASGSIVKALKANKKVIAVTRLEKYGEHIDDHQIQMNKAFEMNSLVLAVYEIDELKDAIITMEKGHVQLKQWNSMQNESPISIIDEFIMANWKYK